MERYATAQVEKEQLKSWAKRIDNATGLPTEEKRRSAMVELLLETKKEASVKEDARWNPVKAKFL
eukprot:COSAG05_NODE_11743_length_499_cov_0.512500_1_plen_64_part_10